MTNIIRLFQHSINSLSEEEATERFPIPSGYLTGKTALHSDALAERSRHSGSALRETFEHYPEAQSLMRVR